MTDTAAPTIDDLEATGLPFVLADHLGVVLSVNESFEVEFGWAASDLVGTPLARIVPESLEMAHQAGFSRFQATEVSTILAHPLRINARCGDGTERFTEHFIVGERRNGQWLFGATITPVDPPVGDHD